MKPSCESLCISRGNFGDGFFISSCSGRVGRYFSAPFNERANHLESPDKQRAEKFLDLQNIAASLFRRRQFPTQSFSLHFKTKDFPSLQPIRLSFGLTERKASRNRLIFGSRRTWEKYSYSLGDRAPDSTQEVFKDQAAVERAWGYLAQLGIDRSQFVKTNVASYGEWGVAFPRQIDGIQFYDDTEGFSFQQFGSHGKIRCFRLALPNLEREQNSPTADAQQIISCIRGFKTAVVPDDKPNYFARVKNLANARKFTITKITPYYSEGIYGEMPTNNEPSKVVSPMAELEAVADFGNSNATVRLLSPILSSEVNRLLGK